jgi:hypothetical protein
MTQPAGTVSNRSWETKEQAKEATAEASVEAVAEAAVGESRSDR